MRRAAFALALTFLVVSAQAAPVPGTLADPQQEARARALQKELRCLVCQGESIDDSNAQIAGVVRELVREQIVAGKSDQEIKNFLVARYGNFILMKPPLETGTYVLWLVPFVLLLTGFGVTTLVVLRAKKRSGQISG